MLPAVHIKRNIDFNKSFRSLLEVLKLVAVSEYHNLEHRFRTFDRLNTMLGEFFDSVDLSVVQHPFLNPKGQPCVVAVTSDAGLLGGMNNQVISKAIDMMHQMNGKLLVIGERGLPYVQEAGLPFVSYPGIVDANRYNQALEIRNYLLEKVLKDELGPVHVVYPRAHSIVTHRTEVVTLIPFNQLSKATSSAQPMKRKPSAGTLLESSAADVCEYLVSLIVAQRLFEIFGYARICEQAARYLHLEESCNKIQEMNKKLYLQYFRRRHEIIDANMRDLFASRALYANK
jgi:ATP synthase F1 gamma subunit